MLKLVLAPNDSQKDLAASLFLSQAEISHGIKRLKQAQLINSEGFVIGSSCVEFVVHGLKYMCPAELGPLSTGIPTAFAHPDFKYVKYRDDSIYIWPSIQGKKKGMVLVPFYESVPKAALADPKLYVLLSLIEMIRAGRAREKEIAAKEIEKMILKHTSHKISQHEEK